MLQKELKEIVFLCLGDSTDASTWSNVPYLFAQALEKKSILVRRVDITPPSVLFKFLKIAYKIFITTPLKFIYKDSVHNFYRSKIFLKLANKHIDKQLAKYPNADLCIFLNFDFYNKITNAPTLLFGDWTLEILVKDRHKREMYPIEKKFADYEMDVINHAQYVIPMFPETAKFLTQKNVKPKVCYLGMNMVNNLYKGGVDESIIKNKKAKKQILFIGRKNYLKSAIKTIEAVNLLGNEVELHIVGLQADDVNIPSKNTIFHGFLHKDNQEENQEYYNLLINSSLVVNANPEWGGFSSIIESMYFYNPVIVAPYKDFLETFGKEIDFGIYNTDFTAECIAENIKKILEHPDYENLCISAHNAVKDFTWDSFAEKLIQQL